MPRIYKMGKKQLLKFKRLLLKRREELLNEISNIGKDASSKSQRDAAGDLSGYTYHMADLATDSFDRELSFNRATTEQDVVYEIDEALKRIEDGAFGRCVNCDKKITSKRLSIVPYAKFCIKCQKDDEKGA